jgi:hypothetical protein
MGLEGSFRKDGDLTTKPGISDTLQGDQTLTGTETKRGDEVGEDTRHIDEADKSIELDMATMEGVQEIGSKVAEAMTEAQDVHAKISEKLDGDFEEMQGVETNLDTRGDSLKSDVSAIEAQILAMISKDTSNSKTLMDQAKTSTSDESEFMKESASTERTTREEGQSEMNRQKSEIGRYKPKYGG